MRSRAVTIRDKFAVRQGVKASERLGRSYQLDLINQLFVATAVAGQSFRWRDPTDNSTYTVYSVVRSNTYYWYVRKQIRGVRKCRYVCPHDVLSNEKIRDAVARLREDLGCAPCWM